VFLLPRSDRLLEQTSIALVGKYTKLSDSYASVIKALEHSALAINYKLEVKVRNDSNYSSSNILYCYDGWDNFVPFDEFEFIHVNNLQKKINFAYINHLAYICLSV